MNWFSYPKVERLDTDEEIVAYVEQYPYVFVEPKIDGSNVSIWMQDGELKLGKRSSPLLPNDSFRGFRDWVAGYESRLLGFFSLMPNAVIFGEWLVPHSVQYATTSYDKMYVFDISIDGRFVMPDRRISLMTDYGIPSVPLLATFEFKPPTVDKLKAYLANSYLEPQKYAEGIVIKGYDSNHNTARDKFDRVDWKKLYNAEYSENKGKRREARETHEEHFANLYVTESRVAKIHNDILGCHVAGQHVLEAVVHRVMYDCLEEEFVKFLKRQKVKKFDFSYLKFLVNDKVFVML